MPRKQCFEWIWVPFVPFHCHLYGLQHIVVRIRFLIETWFQFLAQTRERVLLQAYHLCWSLLFTFYFSCRTFLSNREEPCIKKTGERGANGNHVGCLSHFPAELSFPPLPSDPRVSLTSLLSMLRKNKISLDDLMGECVKHSFIFWWSKSLFRPCRSGPCPRHRELAVKSKNKVPVLREVPGKQADNQWVLVPWRKWRRVRYREGPLGGHLWGENEQEGPGEETWMQRRAWKGVFQTQKCPESLEMEGFHDQPNGQSSFKDVKILGLVKDKRSQISKPAEGASISMMESQYYSLLF